MDEVYYVVNRIQDGFITVRPGCHLDPSNADSVPVQVLTEKGIVNGLFGSTTAHLKQWEKPCELFIDVGGNTDDILPGDAVIYAPNLFWMGEHLVASKALDDRHSCAILIQLAEMFSAQRPKDTVYLVGTRMEETGMQGGAAYIAKTLLADVYISIDTNYGYDPKLPEKQGPGGSATAPSSGDGKNPTSAPFVSPAAASPRRWPRRERNWASPTDSTSPTPSPMHLASMSNGPNVKLAISMLRGDIPTPPMRWSTSAM